MDITALNSALDIRIGDSDNFTYTPEEKLDALTEAFNDGDVLDPVWEDTLTFANGTYQYALPSGITVVQDIYIKPDNNLDEPEKISAQLWEVVGGNIQFKNGAQGSITNGYGLYLKGYNKVTISDTVTDVALQNYILDLAQLKLLRMLGVKKALRFLKNDTSMAEVVAIKRELEREVQQYKQRLPRAWESA